MTPEAQQIAIAEACVNILGHFDDEFEAAKAYDVAARTHKLFVC